MVQPQTKGKSLEEIAEIFGDAVEHHGFDNSKTSLGDVEERDEHVRETK